jgi:hypothetical protein
MASHFSLWHSDILRFKLVVFVLVAVLLALHVLTPSSRVVSYGIAVASPLVVWLGVKLTSAGASPGKTAEPVAAAASDARCTCTKGRASMLTHRGPESSPR